MTGNGETIAAVPARAPVSSAPAAAVPAPAGRPSGNGVAAAGHNLPPEPPPSETGRVEETVRRLNELMAERQRSLSFRVDEASGRTVITVREAGTDRIVRQIPSEEVLVVARLFEGTGALVDVQI